MANRDTLTAAPPSRALSLAVSVALVVVWGTIRLVVFDTTMFPLTYALPLLVCVWSRDRVALWSMAAIFVVFHAIKLFWILPPGSFAAGELWTNYSATLTNVSVGAVAVHIIINLRERLEATLADVRAQAEELRAQGEELAQQNEELAEQAEELSYQTEELTQQGEELASQNEELHSQSEEITTLNGRLERRERLLQALLDTARLSAGERAALQHITSAALDLFGGVGSTVAVYERTDDGVRLRAVSHGGTALDPDDPETPTDRFVDLVLQQNRTASITDVSLRPDLTLARIGDVPPFGAALCAPIHFGSDPFGAFTVYSAHPHEWTDEEFRLAEWLASQCGRVLQALRVQSDLREADRRKSEFLATLSHELRNPLAPIGFALKLIEAGNGRDGKPIRIMRRQLQQLVRLVDDLLDATRLSSNKIQIRRTRADLVAVVMQAVDASRPHVEAAGHTLAVIVPPAPVWVNLDADRMAQVVTNLLNNATRYTPAGGRLTVEISTTGDDAVLSVADTGVGLSQADLERVFEMFTQVGGPGSGGLGIGLALVRGIVELHEGRVEARSEGPGRGCQFRVLLPLAAATVAVDAGIPARPGLPAVSACRVLVVDDDRDSAEMMSALLELHGHTVRMARDADNALAAAATFAPDVALLDTALPGVDGYDLARRLRADERTRHMRLVAVTESDQQADRARAQEAGFDAHLTKPAEPEMVLSAIAAESV